MSCTSRLAARPRCTAWILRAAASSSAGSPSSSTAAPALRASTSLRAMRPRCTAWILSAAASSSASSSLRRAPSLSMRRAACSAGSLSARMESISDTARPTMLSSEASSADMGGSAGGGAAGSCSSLSSSRRRSLPSYMAFWCARPRRRRCSSTTASCAARSAGGSVGVSGRSTRFTTILARPAGDSTLSSSSGAGQQSPCPRSPSAADLLVDSRPLMLSRCAPTLFRDVSVAVGLGGAGRTFTSVTDLGIVASSSSTPRYVVGS
mmetsp:Transcript_24677/g.84393  ORF Transcript_24677/g.84393 Transcript_24677/m.84393 type:complete len:265 (-) Transcript_24677:2512-3306(-)